MRVRRVKDSVTKGEVTGLVSCLAGFVFILTYITMLSAYICDSYAKQTLDAEEGNANVVMCRIVAVWRDNCSLASPEPVCTMQQVTQPQVCSELEKLHALYSQRQK